MNDRKYANLFASFQEALSTLGQTLAIAFANPPSEGLRDAVHRARVEVLRQYNDVLTALQKAETGSADPQ